MPKSTLITMPTAWVKNVYSLRIDSGMNSGYPLFSYTGPLSVIAGVRGQVPSFTQLITQLSAVLSTVKNHIFNLLHSHLYPVSTAPTIKKKKENKKRNS